MRKTKEEKTPEYLKLALKLADNPDCHFIADIAAEMPISLKQFYNHKLHEVPELKEKLEKNKIAVKQQMRKRWQDWDNATLQIALYKLLADNEEREALRDKTNNEPMPHNEGLKIIFE